MSPSWKQNSELRLLPLRTSARTVGRIASSATVISAALALLGDVVEHDTVARYPHVPLLQRRRAVMMVQLGVLLPADAKQPEVDQAHGACGHPITVQVAAAEISHGGRPQRGQRGGELEHVRELLGVALLTPQLVVEVLGPSPAVYARGLDMTERVWRDPNVLPGRRNGERTDPPQCLGVRDILTQGIAVPKAFSGRLTADPRTARFAAGKPGNRGRRRRQVAVHQKSPFPAPESVRACFLESWNHSHYFARGYIHSVDGEKPRPES